MVHPDLYRHVASLGHGYFKLCHHVSLWYSLMSILPWWRHQVETFSALLALCAGNSPVPVNSPHKGQWRGALVFSLIYVWINDWVNNREAGDLRRQRGHYDVIVMLRSWDPWHNSTTFDELWTLNIKYMDPMTNPRRSWYKCFNPTPYTISNNRTQ